MPHYEASEGEFVDFATLDDWRQRDVEKDATIARLTAGLEAARAQIGAVLGEAADVAEYHGQYAGRDQDGEWYCGEEAAIWGGNMADIIRNAILALSPDAPAALERALRAERNKTRRECAKIANDNFECPPGYYGDGPGAAILAALEGQP